MRDPLDRFHSRYRFNREILPKLQNQLMIRQARGRSKNINDCVKYNHTECKYSGALERYLIYLSFAILFAEQINNFVVVNS